MSGTILAGRLSRLVGDMEDGSPVCAFRIGSIACRAVGGLAVEIATRRGYPGHEVKVSGTLIGDKKKVLDVSELIVLD